MSRRCSRGRSTVPSGIVSPPRRRHIGETRPSCGCSTRSGISWSRVSGTSSGGSHTWWAAGPSPTIRETATSSSDSCSPWCATGDHRDLVLGRVEREHLGDRERQDAAQVAALVATYARPAGRRPGDVGGLELQQRRLVRLEVAEAGDGGQLVGIGYAEHRARLGGRERAQADPVGQVRLQAAEPALLEPLAGEQQVQAERAAEATDGDEQVDELRLGGEHLGELVDDDEQRRHRGEVLAGGAGLLVVADRGEVAGLAQQLLAAHHLAGQGVLHAVDEGELLGEVRDHRGDVRHLGHAGERRAALEVDEHHVEVLGGVRHRQPEHQGAQELRLAGAGRTDHQAVRAHALLGGLLDVEVDRAAALGDADRHPQPVARGARAPGGAGVERVHVTEAEEVHEVGGAGGLAVATGGDGVQRRQPAGERLGGGQVALVREAADRLGADPQRGDRELAVLGRRVGELQPQPGRVVELVPALREVDQRDAVQAVGRDDVVARRQLAAVDDQQDVRGRLGLVGAEAGAVAEVRRQHRAEVVERGGHHPARADGVALLAAQRVGQPLQPVPVGQVVVGAEHRDREVLGVVERRRRADHRAGQGPRRVLLAGQLDPVEGPQVDRGGQVRLHPVHDQQPVQRRGRGRVHLVDRRAVRRHQLERERLRGQAVAHVQEVLVARRVLPEPHPVLGQRRQRGRVRVVPGQRRALLVGGVAGHLADVREVLEVLRAGAGQLLGALLPGPVDLHHDEADRGEQEHARGDHHARVAAAAGGLAHARDQHDGADAAEHRDGGHQRVAGTFVRLQLGRCLELDLPAGHLRRVEPLSAAERGHASPLSTPSNVGSRW